MNTRKLGNIPHVQHSEALSHTRNGEQSGPYFGTHNASKPSRLQILRNTTSKKNNFTEQSSKKFTLKSLVEVRMDETDINTMKSTISESWFSLQEDEIVHN